ncbi:MAG: DUF6691 family protein [Pseudomonadota bacterium]
MVQAALRRLVALGAGLVFGLGLVISDMVDPARVRAFLDLFGAWDPTLIFVMGGAMAVSFVGWRVAEARQKSLLGGALPAPPGTELDSRLLSGAALFGIGWGLVGICPGPALVALSASGAPGFLVFFVAMLAGMAFWTHVLARQTACAAPSAPG